MKGISQWLSASSSRPDRRSRFPLPFISCFFERFASPELAPPLLSPCIILLRKAALSVVNCLVHKALPTIAQYSPRWLQLTFFALSDNRGWKTSMHKLGNLRLAATVESTITCSSLPQSCCNRRMASSSVQGVGRRGWGIMEKREV